MHNGYFKEADYYDVFPLKVPEYDDIRVPPALTVLDLLLGASFVDYKGGYVLEFDASADKFVKFNVQLPHGYNIETNLHPHVHWVASDANSGNVRWQLSYSWANIGDAFADPTVITVDAAAPESADIHSVKSFSELTGTGKHVSSMLICELGRLGTADTYGSSAYLVEFDIHVQVATLGTQTEYPSA